MKTVLKPILIIFSVLIGFIGLFELTNVGLYLMDESDTIMFYLGLTLIITIWFSAIYAIRVIYLKKIEKSKKDEKVN
jgi:hypothetical protein